MVSAVLGGIVPIIVVVDERPGSAWAFAPSDAMVGATFAILRPIRLSGVGETGGRASGRPVYFSGAGLGAVGAIRPWVSVAVVAFSAGLPPFPCPLGSATQDPRRSRAGVTTKAACAPVPTPNPVMVVWPVPRSGKGAQEFLPSAYDVPGQAIRCAGVGYRYLRRLFVDDHSLVF